MRAKEKYHYEYLIEGTVYDKDKQQAKTEVLLYHDYYTAKDALSDPYSALENARLRRKRVYE